MAAFEEVEVTPEEEDPQQSFHAMFARSFRESHPELPVSSEISSRSKGISDIYLRAPNEDDDDDEGEGYAGVDDENDEEGGHAPAGLSDLERAAHEETVTQLLEMFPEWKHADMEALLSSCGDKMDEAVEEIMRLGEAGASQPVAAAAGGGSVDDEFEVDLSRLMTRAQIDDYERHVINQIKVEEGEGEDDPQKVDELMTMALIVPPGASPGTVLKVTVIDGSEYTVHVPAGVAAGGKFLVQFPTAPMREAARRQLLQAENGGGQDGGGHQRGGEEERGVEGGDDDFLAEVEDQEVMERVRAESVAEDEARAQRQKDLEAEEEELMRRVMAESALEAEGGSA